MPALFLYTGGWGSGAGREAGGEQGLSGDWEAEGAGGEGVRNVPMPTRSETP